MSGRRIEVHSVGGVSVASSGAPCGTGVLGDVPECPVSCHVWVLGHEASLTGGSAVEPLHANSLLLRLRGPRRGPGLGKGCGHQHVSASCCLNYAAGQTSPASGTRVQGRRPFPARWDVGWRLGSASGESGLQGDLLQAAGQSQAPWSPVLAGLRMGQTPGQVRNARRANGNPGFL